MANKSTSFKGTTAHAKINGRRVELNPKGKHDAVSNPKHYTSISPSPIEVIEAWNLGFHLGNAVKYIGRHRLKSGREDLKKAYWYLGRHLDNLEGLDK